MNSRILPRMIALLVVVVLGVYYIFSDVLQFRVSSQPFSVTVFMPQAGGLYPGSNVTYRGVQVGTVTALDLGAGEVAVKLALYHGTAIPDNGPVYVRELSALGEQYLDLVPLRAGGPDLRAGSVIVASRVVLPIPIGTTLIDLGSLLSSINPGDLRTVETFLASAFVGTGPGLRSIIVNGQRLFDALVAAQPETVNLVVDGHTDLQTLQATDADLATFSQGLAELTGQLRSSNSDLQALITNSQSAEQQLNPFISANSASLTQAIANLAQDAAVSNAYQPDVLAIFELLPYVVSDLGSVASGGQVHGVLDINTASTVCPYTNGTIPGPTQVENGPILTNSCGTTAPDMLQHGADSNPALPAG